MVTTVGPASVPPWSLGVLCGDATASDWVGVAGWAVAATGWL
ncbi:MAG: hypothetical protein ACRDNJ_02220 [Solirubrobacteraceae bacterium]